MLKRKGDVVVGTNNNELPRLSFKNLRPPLKLNYFYSFHFHVINRRTLVKACSIPNIFGGSSLFNNSLINYEKIICNTKRKLQTINTPSDNLVTIVNNLSSLKENNEFDLHDSIDIPDKIKYLSSTFSTDVNMISVPPNNMAPETQI